MAGLQDDTSRVALDKTTYSKSLISYVKWVSFKNNHVKYRLGFKKGYNYHFIFFLCIRRVSETKIIKSIVYYQNLNTILCQFKLY